MAFKIYNTLSRKKEIFKPLKGKTVRMYTCGPTVYDYAHIGNLRTYVNEDLLKRYLLWKGFRVKHVTNVTDVGHLTDDADQGEDKMVVAEQREHKSAWDIAAFYEKVFKNDLELLGALMPDIWCRATDHISEQITLVRTLERKGYTYKIRDGVYFDTSRLKDYGKLARLNIEGLKAGARVEVTAGKRNATDFALWKLTPAGTLRHMEWDSPWGRGFPGWHIECSAMAMKYLGRTLDVHAGGIDHIPVHHTNEIAQSEAATGRPFAKYWFHCEFLNVSDTKISDNWSETSKARPLKMAKSKGNFLRLQSVIDETFTPRQLRFFYLTAHYRTQQLFSWESLKNAANTLDKLDEFMDRLARHKNGKSSTAVRKLVAEVRKEFERTMDDDLNVPEMWASLHHFVGSINKLLETKAMASRDAQRVLDTMHDFDSVLAVLRKEERPLPAEVKKLIEQREEMRKQKDFTAADELRKRLLDQYGIEVQDTSEGPRWRFIK
ncbi:MAG: cysteine--tRNA ligase [Candidatus Aenigmatarchaeota archaeon]|nr:MAG: cysteine--tRNA ligase [Candidatus Aenigmarchaeota archaeon]